MIDELHFEVRQVEACVVVAVEVVGQVEHYLVSLGLVSRLDELVDPPITNVLHLRVTGDQAIKLELLEVCCVQVGDALALVRDQHALLLAESLRAVDNADVAVLVCRVRLFLDVQVDLEFLDGLSFFR